MFITAIILLVAIAAVLYFTGRRPQGPPEPPKMPPPPAVPSAAVDPLRARYEAIRKAARDARWAEYELECEQRFQDWKKTQDAA